MNSVHDQLDALRAAFSGCRLIAFIDLHSELVLSSSAIVKPPQEDLDALASMASRALGIGVDAAPGAFPNDIPPDEAIILSPDRSTLILRAQTEDAEALCCVCARWQDIGALRAGASDTLNKIAAEN